MKKTYHERAKLAEQLRQAEIERLEAINHRVAPTKGIDSGARGKAIELKHSRGLDATVSGHSERDTTIKFETEKGGYIYKDLEVKVDGGRMGDFIAGDTEFIVYGLDVCNSGTSYIRRFVPELVFTREEFLTFLEENNLLRDLSKNGVTEKAMKPTSVKLYNWLLDTLLAEPRRVYDKTKSYNWLLG